jgi:hypothetical protein
MIRPTRLSSLLLTFVTALLTVHLIGQVLFASTLFGGAPGLFALYAETLAISLGLAAIRLQGRPSESAEGWRFVAPPTRVSRVRASQHGTRREEVRPDKSAA